MAIITLFTNETTASTSPAFKVNAGIGKDSFNKSFIQVNGTAGSATLKLQAKDPNGDWHITNDSLKIPTADEINYNGELELRLSIGNVDGDTSISAWALNATEVVK
jgi:hypothetical protein